MSNAYQKTLRAYLTTDILISVFTCGGYLLQLGCDIHWKMFWHLLWVLGIGNISSHPASVYDLLFYKERIY